MIYYYVFTSYYGWQLGVTFSNQNLASGWITVLAVMYMYVIVTFICPLRSSPPLPCGLISHFTKHVRAPSRTLTCVLLSCLSLTISTF